MDILIGIKKYQSGEISIDDNLINESLFKKVKFLYVPQESYLIDDTIKSNIVFPVQKTLKLTILKK